MEETKACKCKFAHPSFKSEKIEFHCVADGWNDDQVKTVTEDVCEKCEKYKSRYIEYPIKVNAISNDFGTEAPIFGNAGGLVKIRPCGEEYDNKTYLGFYVGDLPISNSISYNSETEELKVFPVRNPAIFVPKIGKIIYGCESWWQRIASEKDLKDISDDDINNIRYVELLKLIRKEDNKGE